MSGIAILFSTASGTFYVSPYAPLAKVKTQKRIQASLCAFEFSLSVPRAGLEPAQPSLAKGF